jgi:8-oxo-dGTP diphosphatase
MEDEKKTFCYKYPHPAVTTDNIIFGFDGKELQLLLVERGQEPYKGYWAFPGGFLNIDENAEEGAARELEEETGVKDVYLEQLQAFCDVNRDPRERVITIAFIALVRQKDYQLVAGDDAAKARWFPIDSLPYLAFDHDEILRTALKRLRERILLEPIAFRLLDKEFTLDNLFRLYQSIDHTNTKGTDFIENLISRGIIIQAPSDSTDWNQGPNYYSFNEQKCKQTYFSTINFN